MGGGHHFNPSSNATPFLLFSIWQDWHEKEKTSIYPNAQATLSVLSMWRYFSVAITGSSRRGNEMRALSSLISCVKGQAKTRMHHHQGMSRGSSVSL